MRRELALAAATARECFGVSTRMSEAEVRDPADWTYRGLGLEMDFRLEGFGPEVDLDGQVKFKRGAPAAEIRRLLGTPEADVAAFSRGGGYS